MNWFAARIVFQIISGDGNHTPQFDEQLKLISADDEVTAFEKASLLGQEGQDSFPNSAGEKVQWKFAGVAELAQINAPADGVELYSKIVEAENAAEYLYFIQQKNQDIESRFIPLKTQIN